MGLIRISESDNWIAEYDRKRGMYRVSYFKDGHFVDEYWFDCFEEKEVSLVEALKARDYKVFKSTYNIEDYTFEQIKSKIDEFHSIYGDVIENEKEKYEVHAFKMLTGWGL